MSTTDYNARAVEALKNAMRMQGMEGSKSAFARLVRERVGDGPAPNTVGRWLRGEQTIPAWALIAAAETAQADVGQLLGLETQGAPEQIRLIRGELEKQRQAIVAMERRAGLLQQQRPATAELGDTHTDRLAEVEHQLASLAAIVQTLSDSVEVIQEDLLREGSSARSRSTTEPARSRPG